MATLYIDNDLTIKVSEYLRNAGHTAITTRDIGLESASDDEQLLIAARRSWIFVTHNETDFVLLHDAWLRWTEAWGVPHRHGGILIVPQGRKYGVDWRAEPIARDVIRGLESFASVSNELLRRSAKGWERRSGKTWLTGF